MPSIQQQLQAAIAEYQKKVEKVYRGSMLEVGRRIILRSPVRDGFFKSNWLSDYVKDNGADPTRTDTSYSEGRLTAKVGGLDSGKKFFFVNSMPYAEKLENGSSDQAPMGMVRITTNEFESIANAEIQRVR